MAFDQRVLASLPSLQAENKHFPSLTGMLWAETSGFLQAFLPAPSMSSEELLSFQYDLFSPSPPFPSGYTSPILEPAGQALHTEILLLFPWLGRVMLAGRVSSSLGGEPGGSLEARPGAAGDLSACNQTYLDSREPPAERTVSFTGDP